VILVAVLAVAAVVARACTGDAGNISQDEAIERARAVAVFEPDEIQVRFLRRGVPPRGYWAVSMYRGTAERPTVTQAVLVDAETGDVVDDGLP
jgi:hypothetical protein